ncbi:unnamed protein product, partial [Dovyalis caffra]
FSIQISFFAKTFSLSSTTCVQPSSPVSHNPFTSLLVMKDEDIMDNLIKILEVEFGFGVGLFGVKEDEDGVERIAA